MSTEEHVLKIVFDGGDVDKGLARARTGVEDLQKSATKSAGGLTLIKGGLQGIDRAEREASKALRGFSGTLGSMNSQVGNAIGGIGDLAGLLSGGGVLGIALAAAGAGVLALTKYWEDEARARDAAMMAQFKKVDEDIDATKKLRIEVDGLAKRLQPETAESIFSQLKQDLIPLEQKVKDLRTQLRGVDADTEKNRSNIRGQLTQTLEQIDLLKQRADFRFALLPEEKDDKKVSVKKEAHKYGSDVIKAFYEGQIDAINQDYDERIASLIKTQMSGYAGGSATASAQMSVSVKKGDFPEIDAEEYKLAKMLAMREDFGFAMQELADSQNEYWVSSGQQAAGTMAGSLQTFFNMQAAGAKYAAEVAASQFLTGIGNQLVGMGIKDGFEAGGMAIRGDPRAIPMAALAAAEIGAGIGMGAGGAAIGANVSKKEARDEERARKAEERKKDRERGTGGSRSRGSNGSSEGVTVIINYGVGGPPSESTARHVADAVDTARRNGFGPYGGRRDSWR